MPVRQPPRRASAYQDPMAGPAPARCLPIRLRPARYADATVLTVLAAAQRDDLMEVDSRCVRGGAAVPARRRRQGAFEAFHQLLVPFVPGPPVSVDVVGPLALILQLLVVFGHRRLEVLGQAHPGPGMII